MRRFIFALALASVGLSLHSQDRPTQNHEPQESEYGPAGPPPPASQFNNVVPLPSSRALSPLQLDGKMFFVQRCSVCHLPGNPAYVSIAPLLDGKLIATVGDSFARTQIMRGSAHMPGFQYVLEAADIDKIIGYLKLLSYDPAAKKYTYASSNSLGVGVPAKRPSQLLAASDGSPLASKMLMGSTRAADGSVLEGVAISARAIDGTVTTSVYSDDQGNYYFPALPAGRYKVWAQAAGFDADRAEAALNSAKETRQDFTLKPAKDFTNQLASFEYVSALPEDTPENRRMKAIFRHTCVECHPASFILQNRFDEVGWRAVMTTMETLNVVGRWPIRTNPFIHHYKDELAAYLAKMRGPGPSPMQLKPSPRPTGDAARVVVTEYSVPPAESPGELVDQDGNDWSRGIPSVGNGARGLHDIAVDGNGNAWASDGESNRERSYIKVDPKTGKVTNFKLPGGAYGFARGTHGMIADLKGVVWMTVGPPGTLNNSSYLGRIDPKTEKLAIFEPPRGLGGSGVGISLQVDGTGKIWSASIPGATVFDVAKEKFSYFKPPDPGVGGYGVAGDADGNGWFCVPDTDIIGFADFKTGKVTDFPLTPKPGMEELLTPEDRKFYEEVKTTASTGKITAQGPRRMSAHGNYVWWSDWWGAGISRADIHTHEISYYAPPIPSNVYTTVADKNGKVWVPMLGDERVGKFDPATEQWTVYHIPSMGNELRHIAVDNRKDPVEVWVPSYRTSKVIRLQFRTAEQLRGVSMAGAKGVVK